LRVRTERAERSQFQGSIASAQIGPLLLNRVRSERHLVRRSRNALTRDTDEWFFVNLHQAGHSILSQGGRDQAVDAGDLCLFDSTRPFDLDFPTDMALTCFLVPRAALIARTVDAPDTVARAIPRHGAGALFHNFSASLARTAPTLAPSEAAQAGVIFLDLLALALGATASTREAARPSVRQAVFATIRADIRSRLSDPRLSVATVAARARIAPRTLQTLFQERGTSFTSYVLEQRLLLAERQLSRLAADVSITEVAYAVGFSDLSYFSRCFHRRFGLSPRDFRAALPSRRMT
jgi:AraC-like DNA-binding protein